MKRTLQQLFILLFFGIGNAKAQYYLNKSGDLTTDMKKAYYSRKVTPEFKDGRRQYILLEKFVHNDQIKTTGISLTSTAPYTFVGIKETFHPNGSIKSKETFTDKGQLIDTAYYYYPSGALYLKTYNPGQSSQTYKVPSTEYILYYDSHGNKKLENGNGIIHLTNLENDDFEEGSMISNNREGKWIGQSKESSKKKYTFNEYYEKGKLIHGEKIKSNGKIVHYDSTNYKTNPTYPDGMVNFMKFVSENYDYPQEAMDNRVQGIVYIAFIVEKDGSLSDIKTKSDLGFGTGAAGVAIIKKSKKWTPGLLRGEPVRISYILPIRLNLR